MHEDCLWTPAARTGEHLAVARGRKAYVAAAVLAVLAIGCLVAFKSLGDPNRRFTNYVHQYATGWRSSRQPGRPQRDQTWIDTHKTAVVAAGKRSCDWLAKQPDAPKVRPPLRFDISQLSKHYVTAVEGRDVPLAHWTKWGIVGGAWKYLCPATERTKTTTAYEETD